MAERRMFAKSVTQSGRFYKLSHEAQLLYFALGMAADDDGAVEAYPVLALLRMKDKAAVRELEAAGFIGPLVEEEDVYYITDWLRNNQIRSDRYRPSVYKPVMEGKGLPAAGGGKPAVNQRYASGKPAVNPDKVSIGKSSSGQERIGKDSQGKYSCSEPADPHLASDTSQSKNRAQLSLPEDSIHAPEIPSPKEGSAQEPDISLRMPLTKNRHVDIPPSWLAEMQSAYPNTDAIAEARKAVAWCKANPKRLKSDWKRFLNNWISKANDSSRQYAASSRSWSGRYDSLAETDFSKENPS